MSKPRYRYNHKTKKCDQLYTFKQSVFVATGIKDPKTGIPVMVEMPDHESGQRLFNTLNRI